MTVPRWPRRGSSTSPLQRHLLEVGYTDTLLAQIIKRLKQTGLWERAMVVVTADHGAAFQSKVPRRAATSENMGRSRRSRSSSSHPGRSNRK